MEKRKRVGTLGEELVVRFLMKQGYTILHRNYWKPWGELDIVAQRKNKIHFIEVKTLSDSYGQANAVTHETSSEREKVLNYIRTAPPKDRMRPEDHVTSEKTLRLRHIIKSYLTAENVSDETKWQCDVVTVLLDKEKKKAKINLIEDVVL